MANSGPSTDVVVVGAGAAGIFAAWRAAQLGARVLLLEKTSRIGTKILISGGGKCNVAHAGPLEDLIRAFRPEEARFIRPACYRLPNDRIMEMVTTKGIELYARPDGRVFPTTATAKDIVAVLVGYLLDAGVKVCINTPVAGIDARDGRVVGVEVRPSENGSLRRPLQTSGFGAKALLAEVLQTRSVFNAWSGPTRIECPQVVVATGGSSYPSSGTTGDGWAWMRSLGHTVVPTRPALAPIYLLEPRTDWSGVALRDCRLKARVESREVARADGDLLFTHQGISGPAALRISRMVAEQSLPVQMEVDLVLGSSFEELAVRVQTWIEAGARRPIDSLVEDFIPDRLVPSFLANWGIEPGLPGSQVPKKLRNRLVTLLKGWPIGQVRAVPLEKGEVVAGGVSLQEVDPQTMKSKLVEGLYLCGEILDVAGPVGGYNLQAAFATGYVAGESAAKALKE